MVGEKIEKFLKHIIEIVFLLTIVFYFVYCHIYQFENPSYKVVGLIPIAILFVYFCVYKLCGRFEKNDKFYKILLFVFSIVVYAIWGLFANSPAVSDYEVLINSAKEMISGNFSAFSFDKSNYFYFYNFQTGYVVYLALIMKMFGQKLLALKIVEIFVMALTNVLVYDIASKVYSKKIGIIASVVYASLLFNIAGSSIINNQHISMLFVCIAVLLFMKKKWYSYVLSGILFGISIILRPSAIIFPLACASFLVWKLLIEKFKDWKKNIVAIILILVSMTCFTKIFDFVMVKSNMVPVSAVDSNAKYFKFVLGLQGDGLYNIPTKDAEHTQVYFDLEKLGFDYDEYNKQCMKKIVEICVNTPRRVLEFISKKLVLFCGSADNQLEFASENIKESKICTVISYYGYVQYILILVLCLIITFFSIFRNNKIQYDGKYNNYDKLFKIVFVAFFVAHIFIEVQSRYRYDQYLMLCLISSPMLVMVFEKIKNVFKDIKK